MMVKDIAKKVDALQRIVASWSEESPLASIERDMAISYVKEIYEMLRFAPEVTEREPERECVVESESEEVAIEQEPEEADEADRKKMRLRKFISFYRDDEEVEAKVEAPAEEETQAPIIVEEPQEEEPQEEEPQEEEPQEEEKRVEEPTAPASTSRELLDTLSINDRMLLSNELFGGDVEAMEQLVLVLGALPTLDDALIYIAQRYRWRGDNEGAKLLFSLLKNRYLQS